MFVEECDMQFIQTDAFSMNRCIAEWQMCLRKPDVPKQLHTHVSQAKNLKGGVKGNSKYTNKCGQSQRFSCPLSIKSYNPQEVDKREMFETTERDDSAAKLVLTTACLCFYCKILDSSSMPPINSVNSFVSLHF